MIETMEKKFFLQKKSICLTIRFFAEPSSFLLFLCLMLSLQISKAEEINYSHPNLYLLFKLNTDTQEAMLGSGVIGEENGAYAYPDMGNDLWNGNLGKLWENIKVPETISCGGVEYTVTSVAPYAFYKSTDVKSITLPETIKQIGESAFAWCTNLKRINIPSQIKKINGSTFYLCRQLTEIILPSGIQTIGNSAFGECWQLRKINIPGNCTEIGNDAFSWCGNLTNLIIEEGNAPLRCGYSYGLSIDYQGSLDVPKFRGIFADSPIDTLFCGRDFVCPTVKGRTYRPFLSISNYGNETTASVRAFTGKRFKNLKFSNNLTTIQDSLFWSSSIDNELILPTDIKYIGIKSFNASFICFSQDSLIIPNSVDYIGTQAFEGCRINKLKLLGPCEQWGTSTFNKCKIQRLIIGSSVKSFANIGINEINYVECLPSLPPISTNPFGTIPVIVSDGAGSQYRMQWGDATIIDRADEIVIVNVKTPGSLYSRLLAQEYQLDKIYKLKLKGSLNDDDLSILTSMDKVYYYDLSELDMQKLPKGFFSGMEKLFNISLPQNLTKLETNEFKDCIHLSGSIEIPATCTSIGGYAFTNTNIQSLSCLGNINIGYKAFSCCASLSNIKFHGATSIEDYAFYDDNITEVDIPAGSVLKNNAFSNSNLSIISFADGVESIGEKALGDNICSITFNGRITKIGHQTFERLKDVKVTDISTWCQLPFPDKEIMSQAPSLYINNQLVENITLPDNIILRDYAFYNCKTLVSATITDGISFIPNGFFSGCSNLGNVKMSKNITQIGSEAFKDCSTLTNLTIPASVTIIGDSTFSGCAKLIYLELPQSLKQIGDGAFKDCLELSGVDLPLSLISIGKSAFMGCGLKAIRFSTNISSIGELAFANNKNLEEIRVFWQTPIVINENTFSGVNPNCFLYVPIMAASKYHAAGWNIGNLKETGVLKVTVQGGGEIILEGKSVRDSSEEILFAPYKSFYLTLNPDEKHSIRKLKLNGENAISLVEDGKIFIEEPEENIEIFVVFGSDFIKNGDVNGDGLINDDDVKLLMRYIVKDKLETFCDYASDMNDDDIINVTDVLLIISSINK